MTAKRRIQQIKITQKKAGISPEDHQANVLDVSKGRVKSCTGLTEAEQKRLIARYKRMAPKDVQPPQLMLIFALWKQIKAANGINSASAQALRQFCKNHLDGKTLEKGQQHWPKIITMLKKFKERAEAEQQRQGAAS